MKAYSTLKKCILAAIVILVGCDISLLFAAQNSADPDTVQQLQQLQQLQAANAKPTPINGNVAPNLQAVVQAAQSMPAPANYNSSSMMPVAQAEAAQAMPQQDIAQASNPNLNLPPPAMLAAQTPSSPPLNANQQMVNSDTTPLMPEEGMSQTAFNAMARNTLPMSPEQIQRLKRMFNASQYAAAAPATTPPRPTAVSKVVSLEPGTTPPVIRLAQGFVSSLIFLDSTGAPWPIEAYDIGNPSAFNIQWNKTDHNLMVQANSLYTYGNLAVKLKGLQTPIMISLIPGQQAVDYRVDLHIPRPGPNPNPIPQGDGLPNIANPELLGVLDGVPPTGSRMLTVSGGGDSQAWLGTDDKLYLRTRLTLLSPSWLATMSSIDGMRAYQMQKTPLLLVSQHGKPVQLKIEGL